MSAERINEAKNKRVGLLVSVGIHFSMLLLFLFVMGWTAPDPPLGDLGSGYELNFGTDDQGSGDVQSYDPGGDPQKAIDETQSNPDQKEVVPVEKSEAKQDEAKEDKQLTSNDEESTVTVKDSKKDTKKEESKESVDNKKKVIETKKDPVKDVKVNDVYKAPDGGKKSTTTGGQNEGDDKGKEGNKGKPEGTLDPNGQYTGKPGTGGGENGGNGFGLEMSGWGWDSPPQPPKLPDNENGKLVFEIEVDSDGEITGIKTIEKTLSPEAEKLCRQEIQKRSFVRTAATAAPAKSRGTITFVLKTR